MNPPQDPRFAGFVYRFRFLLSFLVLAVVAGLMATGGGRVGEFTAQMGELGDTSNGSGAVQPLVFDPRMDLWFGAEDEAVLTYREIEDRFVAEDYIMVTFEATEGELGVFEPEALSAIARLTEGFLRVPGVRHVRSLTSNPWIRYGDIEDASGTERGLLISDLVEGPPSELTEDERIERMVAVLGAERVAARVGEARVRAVIGEDARFEDHIGEPLLLGTIIDESGTTSAIQVQVLRPRVDGEALETVFGDDSEKRQVAKTLYSVQAQRSALRGIEHVLRQEQGLAVPTPESAELRAWIDSLPEGAEREALRIEFADPNRNFMENADGERVRKFFEYEPDGSGGFADHSDPASVVAAPADFRPEPQSPYAFQVGGVPLFELNFEEVGMSDAKYMGLMFVAIAILLALVFRSVVGVVAPMVIVFASLAGMVGSAFAMGDLLNNMTIIGPNMLTAVSIADAVHLVAAWAALRPKHSNKRDLIIDVVQRNALPVFLTSVTTAVGFFSLTISEMVPVKMFGYTTGLGTIFAYALSMTVVPAILSIVPHRSSGSKDAEPGWNPLGHGWEQGLSNFVFRNRGRIVAVSGGLLVLALFGLFRLRIDSDFRAMFPDDNPVMSDFNWIESRMGGVGDLEIVFDGISAPASGAELDRESEQRLAELRLRRTGTEVASEEFEPLSAAELDELATLEEHEEAWNRTRIAVSGTFLSELDRFETRLREEMADPDSPMSVVTDFLSPLDILRRMHKVQNGDRVAFYRVPGEEDVPAELRSEELSFDEWTEEWLLIPGQSAATLAAQYYLQYENGARPGENLATQVSMDRTQFRIQGRVVQAPSEKMVQAGKRIEEIARDEFPFLGARLAGASDGPELDVSGKMLLFARTNRIFTVGFVRSITIAVTIITLLIGFIFRSVRIALVSIVPNVLPILIPLSVFGLLGLPIDAPAIFVASVALGVCVDDSIHFFTKFLLACRRGESVQGAVRYTFEASGLAITVTTVVLAFGFGMLVLSDFSPNYMMGTLAAAMILLAWVADILVTPAILSYVHPEARSAPEAVPSSDPVATLSAS